MVPALRGKSFSDRANLEDRVSVQRASIARTESAIGYDPASLRLNDADNDPHALPIPIDSVDKHPPDLGIRWDTG